MSWAKLSDDFHSHPKVLAVGNVGAGLFARSVAYAAHYLTDGFLPAASAHMLAGPDQAVMEQLVAVGLWEPCPGGYRIHEYLERNPTKAEMAARRAATSERQRRHRDRTEGEPGADLSRGLSRGLSRVTRRVTNASVFAPVPVPVKKKNPDARARATGVEGRTRAREADPAPPGDGEPVHPLALFQEALTRIARSTGRDPRGNAVGNALQAPVPAAGRGPP
jgi:hypothetical protein